MAKKREIVSCAEPIMFLHMSPNNANLEYIHSINHFAARFGSSDCYDNKFICFARDRAGEDDPPKLLITTKVWEWCTRFAVTNLTDITAHFTTQDNREKLFSIPVLADVTDVTFP